jgi:uncharacterized protein YkwD
LPPPSPTPSESAPAIRVEAGGQAWEASLPDRPITIGTGARADLRLEGSGIGAEHCRIDPLPEGGHALRHLAAGLATRVNGSEVQQVRLRPGDRLEIGAVAIVYHPAAAPAPPTPPPVRPRTQTPARTGAPARSGARSGHHLHGALLGIGAAAVLAILLAILLGSSGDDERAALASRRLGRALDLYRANAHLEAERALESLLADDPPEAVRQKAERYLETTRAAVKEAEEALDRLEAHALDIAPDALERERTRFLAEHGSALAERLDDVIMGMTFRRDQWRKERLEKASTAARSALSGGRYAEARAAWMRLRQDARPGILFDAEATAGLREVEDAAAASADRLLEEVQVANRTDGPKVAADRLRDRLGVYEGTAAHAKLSAALARYERDAREAVLAAGPEATGPTPAAPTPSSEGPATPAPETNAVATALEEARDRAGDRDYAGAADRLAALGDALPPAVEGRREDYASAAAGLQALIADIPAHPERYRHVTLGSAFQVSLVDADAQGVTGSIGAARTRYKWTNLSDERVGAIAKRMQAEGPVAVDLAAMFAELGNHEEADRLLVKAVAGGVDEARVFARIARWRDEPVPDGGYVVWQERYVTPAERDRLARLQKMEELAKDVHRPDAETWKKAAEALLAMGTDGKERLGQALQRRRAAALERIAGEKDLSSTKTKQRLYRELEARRAHALALIEDAQAWPYPNPDGRNTDEVVRRVDAVREIWEDPFGLVVSWSKKLQPLMAEVAEIDGFLQRVDPKYEPDIDTIAERVNLAIDMPSFTPDAKSSSLREYSLQVLAYNVKVHTTATREEKDDVRAVNEYRMMMGRQALKINERLVRAARGHSRHMREHDYFAHDVPPAFADDTNRSPGHRAKAQGYGGGVGENIARGTWSGRDAFWAWFHSSGHHRNMVAAGWTEMGAGRSGGTWWTQVFGAMSGKSLKEPDELDPPGPAFAPEPEDELGRPVGGGRGEVPNETPPPGSPPPDEGTDDPGGR